MQETSDKTVHIVISTNQSGNPASIEFDCYPYDRLFTAVLDSMSDEQIIEQLDLLLDLSSREQISSLLEFSKSKAAYPDGQKLFSLLRKHRFDLSVILRILTPPYPSVSELVGYGYSLPTIADAFSRNKMLDTETLKAIASFSAQGINELLSGSHFLEYSGVATYFDELMECGADINLVLRAIGDASASFYLKHDMAKLLEMGADPAIMLAGICVNFSDPDAGTRALQAIESNDQATVQKLYYAGSRSSYEYGEEAKALPAFIAAYFYWKSHQ